MNHMKTIDVPASTREVVDYVTCDLCHERIVNPGAFCVDDITVSRHEGMSYSDGGDGTDHEFDICSRCWRDSGADARLP